MLTQVEQAMYAEGKSSFLFEVVDPPIQPKYPHVPKRMQIIVLSIVISLALGVLLAHHIESRRVKFTFEEESEGIQQQFGKEEE